VTNSAYRISRTEQRLRYGSIKAFIKEKAAADNEGRLKWMWIGGWRTRARKMSRRSWLTFLDTGSNQKKPPEGGICTLPDERN
jgi:hypothetical protein